MKLTQADVGMKVQLMDSSYAFGIYGGRFSSSPWDGKNTSQTVFSVVDVQYVLVRNCYRQMPQTQDCNVLITDNKGGFWFVPMEFLEPADKEIEVKYFCNGEDVTDSISEETRRNLAGKQLSMTLKTEQRNKAVGELVRGLLWLEAKAKAVRYDAGKTVQMGMVRRTDKK